MSLSSYPALERGAQRRPGQSAITTFPLRADR